MLYNDFQSERISALGLGCMRLPVIDGDDKNIDIPAAEKLIDCAIKNGVNYFDTAWGYHGKNSEKVVGNALSKYERESFYLATKFPGYDLRKMGKVKEVFEKQLENCNTDYFDFYLFHNVCEMNINQYLDERFGTFDYLYEQKKNGRIRHLGFSLHGNIDTTKRFLEKYGEYMEFCQIQLNYVDWSFQDAKAKVELLNKYNIPIWVMEPLRGGKLAKLEPEFEERLKKLREDESIPGWGFRFLQSVEGVTTVLSGMTTLEQLEENIEIFNESKPLNDNEMREILKLADEIISPSKVPCTECRYCVSHCPVGIDIPSMISLYNEHSFTGNGGFIAPMALATVDKDKVPACCVGCRSCESVCPQNIKISEIMKDFTEKLKNFRM